MSITTSPALYPTSDAEIEQLWEDFATRLRGFIASRVNNHADVDDVLQEVFIKIHRSAGQLRDHDRLTTWIFRIAHNSIIDYYRAAPRRREQPVDRFHDQDAHPGADAQFDDPSLVRAEVSACLRPLINELPDHYRQALEMVELDGTSQADAARIVGMTVSGMKSRVQRARTQVFDRLASLCALTIDPRGGPIDCAPAPGSPCS